MAVSCPASMELKEVRGPVGFFKYIFQDFKLSKQGENPGSPVSVRFEGSLLQS